MKLKVDNSKYKHVHDRGAGAVKNILWYYVNLILFANKYFPVNSFKCFVLRAFGAKVGDAVVIKPGVNIKYPWKLTIMDNSWIGENVWIDNLSEVRIGESVTISQGALLLTGAHDINSVSFDFESRPIIIENGSWVGARSIVMGGVTIATHAVLAVNSVAASDLNEYWIYKGNPAIPVLERILE